MTGPITIRHATADDASTLSELICAVLWASNLDDYGPENISRVASHFTPGGVLAMLPGRLSFVAVEAGSIVGTASLGDHSDPQTVSVRTYFVAADQQRRGIGSLLFEALLKEAKDQGAAALSVRSSVAGEPFYIAKGFALVRDHWDGDERTIEMRKLL